MASVPKNLLPLIAKKLVTKRLHIWIAELMPRLIHPKAQPGNVIQWTLLYME
jgi:hypothetical protein